MPERIDILDYVPEVNVANYMDAYREHLQRYHFAADFLHTRDVVDPIVLDVPCGYGYGSAILSRKYPELQCRVMGIDICETTVIEARRHFESKLVWFSTMDMRDLALIEDGTFDAVVSFEGLEHVDETETALSEMHRVLVPDGWFIGSIPREQKGNEWHRRWFPTVQSIRDLFSHCFHLGEFHIGTQNDSAAGSEIKVSTKQDWLTNLVECCYWIVVARKGT